MTALTVFAYGQARLHARHAARLDAASWRRLGVVGDLLQLLQAVRATPMRPWVLPLTQDTGVHALEQWPRDQLRAYVHELGRWQPQRWREALLWTSRLQDLPALRYLLGDEAPRPWMRDDAALSPFVSDDAAARRAAMCESDCAPLVRAHEQDRHLLAGWLEAWRERWPPARADQVRGLEVFARLLEAHLRTAGGTTDPEVAARHREWLEGRLAVGFRRWTHQPAAVYFHLALVVMDVARLRGELVRHRLFSGPTGLDG